MGRRGQDLGTGFVALETFAKTNCPARNRWRECKQPLIMMRAKVVRLRPASRFEPKKRKRLTITTKPKAGPARLR